MVILTQDYWLEANTTQFLTVSSSYPLCPFQGRDEGAHMGEGTFNLDKFIAGPHVCTVWGGWRVGHFLSIVTVTVLGFWFPVCVCECLLKPILGTFFRVHTS